MSAEDDNQPAALIHWFMLRELQDAFRDLPKGGGSDER